MTVWYESSAQKAGAIYSRCTCPVGSSGRTLWGRCRVPRKTSCKRSYPLADQDDERGCLPTRPAAKVRDEADDLDMNTGYDEDEQVLYVHRHRHPEASGKKTLKASNEKIRKHIEAKSHDELVELVWALTERFPELSEEFRDRIALGEGNVDRLVTEARKEIRRVFPEAGWVNSWTGEGQPGL